MAKTSTLESAERLLYSAWTCTATDNQAYIAGLFVGKVGSTTEADDFKSDQAASTASLHICTKQPRPLCIAYRKTEKAKHYGKCFLTSKVSCALEQALRYKLFFPRSGSLLHASASQLLLQKQDCRCYVANCIGKRPFTQQARSDGPQASLPCFLHGQLL